VIIRARAVIWKSRSLRLRKMTNHSIVTPRPTKIEGGLCSKDSNTNYTTTGQSHWKLQMAARFLLSLRAYWRSSEVGRSWTNCRTVPQPSTIWNWSKLNQAIKSLRLVSRTILTWARNGSPKTNMMVLICQGRLPDSWLSPPSTFCLVTTRSTWGSLWAIVQRWGRTSSLKEESRQQNHSI